MLKNIIQIGIYLLNPINFAIKKLYKHNFSLRKQFFNSFPVFYFLNFIMENIVLLLIAFFFKNFVIFFISRTYSVELKFF
jgi:hypothetical protein